MRLVNISADPERPLWVDPGSVIAIGGVAIFDPKGFNTAWIVLRGGTGAVMGVPGTGVLHIEKALGDWAKRHMP